MSLPAGFRLGPYEIIACLGAGGMGEVYRATDTRLHRDVAIKVLPDSLASDPERLARFAREAQTLAALNHPNIAHIYGLEEVGPGPTTGETRRLRHALVMELVDGDDLSVLIARGPIVLADSVLIARQIASALEAAHELGIVHRDLKPANVKVRSDGTVKVLDFGLAKALGPESLSASPDAMNSPTITGHATQLGVILGTAAYMAPEQARGKVVDRRADIWAFGVVLYEMLTGRQAFKGEEISDVLAAVLRQDIDWAAVPGATPSRLTRLLERCLDRDVKQRLRDIGEARIELAKIDAGAPDVAPAAAAPRQPVALAVRVLPWAIAGLCGIALLSCLLIWSPWRSASVIEPRKLLVSIGADASLPQGHGASAILSPDGRTLAFTAQPPGQTARLYVRKLDQLQPTMLPGTWQAADPFFSPDSQSIAYFGSGRLNKVPVSGGAVVILAEAAAGHGGIWLDDDTIVFSPDSHGTLRRVTASGGTSAPFGTLGEGAVTQRWPQALPGGKGVLYTENSTVNGFESANLVVAPLAGDGSPRVVWRGGYYGRYVPSRLASPKGAERGGGHLLYGHQGSVFAVPFDLDRLDPTGPAVMAFGGLDVTPEIGAAQLAFSPDGTLVYTPGTDKLGEPIRWLMRDGTTSELRAQPARWANPRFSPTDGLRLAFDVDDGTRHDIWVQELDKGGALSQLTANAGNNRSPVWTPDHLHIVFSSDRDKPGTFNLYWTNADGTGGAKRLTSSPYGQTPFSCSWQARGKFIAFTENHPGTTDSDVMILPLESDGTQGWKGGTPFAFLNTTANELAPMFSPNGDFIAYFSNESGNKTFGLQYDVYVRPFPVSDGTYRVSTDGGKEARWSERAHELVFLTTGNRSARVATYEIAGGVFRHATPRDWSARWFLPRGFDLHPDGNRLVVALAEEQNRPVEDKVVFFFNFFDYLRKTAPERK